VRVISTSSLPIDLPAQVGAAIAGARVEVPAEWTGIPADLGDVEALVCLLLDRVDADVIRRAPKLRVIANCAVGYDNVDVNAATAAGIAVTNTPDVLTEATAEFAIALMFAAARRLPEAAQLVRSGSWQGWRLDQLLGQPIAGRTLGIVGLGRIGRAVARRAVALGMRVIAAGHDSVTLDELFATADVVSLHCPLTAETRHLVNPARLAQMKPTAILVNTARGGCVDESAVAEAIGRGQIFGAAFDVFEAEPKVDARLRADPRVVLAPHLGSATTEARTAMAQLCADAVIAVLSGRRPGNLVNREATLRG
jgi:glyoxylate reductase